MHRAGENSSWELFPPTLPVHEMSTGKAASAVPGVAHALARNQWLGRSLEDEVVGFVQPAITIADDDDDDDQLGTLVEGAVRSEVPEANCVLWWAPGVPDA